MQNTPKLDSILPLGEQPRGFVGKVCNIDATKIQTSLSAEEIERRLIEFGFVEGEKVEILHQGFFKQDPIAVRIKSSTVALRRKEASAVFVQAEDHKK